MRRLPVGLLFSGALHAALLLGVVAALGGTAPSMLFVDLVNGFGAGREGASGGGGASGEPAPRAAGHDAPRASAPRPRAPSNRMAAAHARSTAPVPAPPLLPRALAPPEQPSAPAPTPATPEPEALPTMPFVLAAPGSVAEVAPAPALPAPPPSDATTSLGGGPAATASVTPSSGDGRGARAGTVAGSDRGTTSGQGGSGSGGGQGAGVGARQGSALALAVPGDGGGGDAGEYEGYFALLGSRLHEILKYPVVARRRGLTGTVHIELKIAPTGTFGAVALAVSSSHRLLDDAALEAVRALGRVPFPPGVRPRPLRVRLPVVFDLR